MKVKFWTIADRRLTAAQVVKRVRRDESLAYENIECAERDKFFTEKVWEICISAKEPGR